MNFSGGGRCRDSLRRRSASVRAGSGAAEGPLEGELQEVVVTGIRHSIETSIAAKRESTSIVEVVSAEDIGKLPDTSIADSIARLPGLAAQRIEGRPAAISIRGLSEDYAGALLNGRQVVSSSEGRSAEYDQFPSELVNQVIVYKTVDAGVVGQGLSGTIDIRPLMPLSLNRRQMALSARAEKNSNGGLSSTGKGAIRRPLQCLVRGSVCRRHDRCGAGLRAPRFARPGQKVRLLGFRRLRRPVGLRRHRRTVRGRQQRRLLFRQ